MLLQFPHDVLCPSWTQDEPKEIRGEYLPDLITLKTKQNGRPLLTVLSHRPVCFSGRSRGERLHLLPEEGGHQPPGDAGGVQEEEQEEEEGRRRQD